MCGVLCSPGFSSSGAPIRMTVSSGLEVRALLSLMDSGDVCLELDSEAFNSVARTDGSRAVVLIAASRENSGFFFSLPLGCGDATFSDSFDGGAEIFFCSDFVSPFTSLSMTPASDFSFWGFEAMLGGG